MDGDTLPGTEPAMTGADRVVLHVDMDCFYASCERLRAPALRGEPVVVGMGYEPGETIGAVATASYEAREFGVHSADPISRALERLPRRVDADAADPDAPNPEDTAHYRPVDLDFYKSVAADVKAVLHDCADVVREVSIDEAYLDVTDRTSWDVADQSTGSPDSAAAGPAERRTLAEGYARYVRDRIEREAGVPASVGVAPNMSAAKIASDHDKPQGLVVVPPGRVRAFLAPLPTEAVHGVGPVTARTLAEMGIETAGGLADADPADLEAELGERGRELHDRARGEDDREVTPTGLPKSLSRESSLPPTDDEATKRERVTALAADVARRARERECLYRTIGVKVVTPPYEVNTRARSLPGPVDDPELVEDVALDLLGEFADDRARKLGVRVSNLDFADSDQSTLTGFDGGSEGDERSRNRSANVGRRAGTAGADATVADASAGPHGESITDWIDRGSSTDSGGEETGRGEETEGKEETGRGEETAGKEERNEVGPPRDLEGQASLGEFDAE
ncbi:DNA polymerase Y family protein [Halopenitus persicus]|uniref:DNA polymerase IV n=1 Tax=Halopenitus persicus TaxID=1048396 RepID=A0A1H3HLT7_9EURY|nr:DNA polymerase IV [Halopenitus persicus]SDY16350.1 DNA polymerase IV (DinB-like DNA polymerase) [Halopenitus persicus]